MNMVDTVSELGKFTKILSAGKTEIKCSPQKYRVRERLKFQTSPPKWFGGKDIKISLPRQEV